MRCHWIRQQDTYALKAEEAIMTDRITFKTSVDADRLLNESESPNQREDGFNIDEVTKQLPSNDSRTSPWDASKKRWVK